MQRVQRSPPVQRVVWERPPGVGQRASAPGLSRALAAAGTVARDGGDPAGAEAAMQSILGDHGLAVDYAVVRDARTLMAVDSFAQPARALVAARLGGVRLIDNVSLLPGDEPDSQGQS